MNLEGKIIGNRYEIIEKIGNGGMATVYKARCTILNRYVAIKVLREEFTTDDEFIKRFNSEAQAAASLTHPNIVSVFDVGQEYNIYYIVMELIQGKTLKEIIEEDGALPWKWTANIAIQICSALEVAHKNGIVHRDIKPHNIIITEDGIAKVTDFGIAKAVSNSTITAFGTTIGSVHYFSPEHARGGYTDAKSDLYSLGVVMYEMVTGRVPFDADTPVSVALKHMQEEAIEPIKLNSRVPVAINEIIKKAMQKDTSFRYATATEMMKDLSMALKNPNVDCVKKKNSGDYTRVIPTISEDVANENRYKNNNLNMENTQLRRKKHEPEKTGMTAYLEKNPKMKIVVYLGIPILFIILVVLIFGGSWKVATKLLGLDSEVTSQTEISLPTVTGISINDAKQKLDELGVKYKIEEIYNDKVKEGEVISQEPVPGTHYDKEKNKPVQLTVSKGIKVVKMPKVKGMTFQEAEEELRKCDLVVDKVEENNDKVQEGIVIKQEVAEGKELNAGTSVKIYVSLGVVKQSVPVLTDVDIETAKKMLEEINLKANIIYAEDTTKSAGIVLKQNIEVGTVVAEGSSVTLTVNKIQEIKEGTVNVNVKSLTGYKEEKDEEGNIKEPKIVSVRVTVDNEDVYKKGVPENTENVNITVKGKGVISIKVYIDEVRKENAQLDLNGENTILDVK